MERKLTAILSADVSGYSRLMGEDEEATIHTLTAYRAVMATLIQQHRGRVVDSPGDNLLAEFASAVDAVQCAADIQRELQVKNTELPVHRQMEFRIGINVGDVVVEGERIYGEGVNIAARVEGLAEAGGLCIAGTVYDQVRNKVAFSYEYLGEQAVKNITEPVRVWRLGIEPTAVAGQQVASLLAGEGQGEGVSGRAGAAKTPHPDLPPQGGKEPKKSCRVGTAHRSWLAMALVGMLLIAGGIVALLFPSLFPFRVPQSAFRNQEAQPPALPLPDKPSIVVLPFVNLSGDPQQGYFSDGMTEDLTTALAKVSGLFVIARNSAFTYKGKAVKVEEVGRELGVRYVVEGSVRRADNRVRINAQLVDATTGHHLWAERYDRPLQDLFALQDEVRQKIVMALKVKLTKEEQERFRRAPTDNLEAYDFFLRGVEYHWRFTKEANLQARQMFEQALALDPQYAGAYAWLGSVYWVDWVFYWSHDPQTLERAVALAQRARALDDSLPDAHTVLSFIYLWKKQPEQALAEAERALALDPNRADGYATLADILSFGGRSEEAIGLAEKAMRVGVPDPHWYLFQLGHAYCLAGRYEEAMAALKKLIIRYPNLLDAHLVLAIASSESGREAEARAAVAAVLRISPNFSLEVMRQRAPNKDPAVVERHLAALRKAGLR